MNSSQQQPTDLRALTQMHQQQEQQEVMKGQAEARKAMEEQRNAILKASVEPDALERLRRVALVKPEKAKAAENCIIQLVKSGPARRGLIDEETVRDILVRVSETSSGGGSAGKIQFRRKKFGSDDDDF